MNAVNKRLQNKVKKLQLKPQPAQRSPEWYKLRHLAVTASEVASCLFKTEPVCRPYIEEFGLTDFRVEPTKSVAHFDNKEEYIIKKCEAFYGKNVFIDSVYTLWGKKYEEIATRLYRKMFNTDVLEFGLLPHSKISWLGASPDGITPDGVMLEIKCPYSRKINGIVPMHYWCQMQQQLEVCDLDLCHFLECELIELKNEEEFKNAENVQSENQGVYDDYKGIVLNVVEEEKNSETKYIYPPDDLNTVDQYINWSVSVINGYSKAGKQVVCNYYRINKWNIINVNRRKDWFKTVKPILKETFGIIKSLQNNKELFEEYKENYFKLKNKDFLLKYHQAECLINDVSDTEEYYMDTDDEDILEHFATSQNIIEDVKDICLLSDT